MWLLWHSKKTSVYIDNYLTGCHYNRSYLYDLIGMKWNPMWYWLCLQVSAVARHHQEEDRGAHRARVHQEGGQRQEGLHLPRLREGATCHTHPRGKKERLSAPVIISAEKLKLVQGWRLLFQGKSLNNDLVGGVMSEAGGVVLSVVFFCRFHFSYNDTIFMNRPCSRSGHE